MVYLADKSALARMRLPAVEAVLAPLLWEHEVATCGMVQLEVLFSARGYNELLATRFEIAQVYPRVPINQADFGRAIEVIAELASRTPSPGGPACRPAHRGSRRAGGPDAAALRLGLRLHRRGDGPADGVGGTAGNGPVARH